MPRFSTCRAFCIFSVYVQICSMYSQYTNRFIPPILSCEQIHCMYSILRIPTAKFCLKIYLIPCTLCIHTYSFCGSFKGILLQIKYVCVQLDQRPTRNNLLFSPSLTKKCISVYSGNTQIDLLIKISRQIQIYIRK